MGQENYTFDMFTLRKELLKLIAEEVRKDSSQLVFTDAKHKACRLINLKLEPKKKPTSQVIEEFRTAFDNAIDIITEQQEFEIEIAEMPPILEDHDNAIQYPTEIDGEPVEVIKSTDKTGYKDETSTYSVVSHPSGYRVCLCPSQKYQLVCKHTLARILERNWRGDPSTTQV